MKKNHFIQVINSNRGIIRSLCKIYYGRVQDQEDAFQDVVLQLWKSFENFRGESEIGTWIYRVSLNTIITKIRKDKRSIAVEPIEEPHHYISNANADDNVELLLMFIRTLKDIDKAIVVLYLEGYRNKEIADILKMTQTNVATRLNRVKLELKMKFNNESHATKQI